MARLRCRLCGGGNLSTIAALSADLDNSCYDRDHSYQKAFSEQRRSERRSRAACRIRHTDADPDPYICPSAAAVRAEDSSRPEQCRSPRVLQHR